MLTILSGSTPGDRLPEFIAEFPKAMAFLDACAAIPAGPANYHAGSLMNHLARCMNEVAGDQHAVWLALCHDAGKLTTPQAMLPHHYNHEERGVAVISLWCGQLGLGQDWLRNGQQASRLHMKAGIFPRLRPGKKLSLLEEIHASSWHESFWKVVDADTKSSISKQIAPIWQEIVRQKECGLSRDGQIMLVKHLSLKTFGKNWI